MLNSEISKRLAEVMKWHKKIIALNLGWWVDKDFKHVMPVSDWNPFRNIEQAFMVRDKIVEDYPDIRQIFADHLDRTVLGRTILHFTAKDICLAALEAMGSDKSLGKDEAIPVIEANADYDCECNNSQYPLGPCLNCGGLIPCTTKEGN